MSYPITDIQGIEADVATALKKAGIRTTGRLLDSAARPKDRKTLAEKTGLPKSHVLISSTHTHSGGSARERSDTTAEEIRDGFTGNLPKLAPYQQFIARRVADSVQIAIKRLEPAKIGWGSVDEPRALRRGLCEGARLREGRSRHENASDGKRSQDMRTDMRHARNSLTRPATSRRPGFC